MQKIAEFCSSNNIIIRSGKAQGADASAIYGCMDAQNKNIINTVPEMFIPWENFGKKDMCRDWDIFVEDDITNNYHSQAMLIAENIHPKWEACSPIAKLLHTRNVFQILGKTLNIKTQLVLYWCKERKGNPTGGTATAVNLAKKYNIITINILHDNWKIILHKVLTDPDIKNFGDW